MRMSKRSNVPHATPLISTNCDASTATAVIPATSHEGKSDFVRKPFTMKSEKNSA